MSNDIAVPEYLEPGLSWEHEGYKVRVGYDECGSECPRDWSNTWTILTSENRSRAIDDELEMDGDDRVREAAIVANVYKYEHSAVSYSAGTHNPFHCPWDSGQVGFAIISKADYDEIEAPKGKVKDEWLREILDSELRTYTAWCNGEIYWLSVSDPDGDDIDSISGIYDDEEGIAWAIREYMLPSIEHDQEKREAEEAEKAYWAARDVVTV